MKTTVSNEEERLIHWKNLLVAPSLDMVTISGKTTGSRKLVFPNWEKHQKNLTVPGDESWRWRTVFIEKITQGGSHLC
jgi:hypothetical protein